jgi:hypothetical protein
LRQKFRCLGPNDAYMAHGSCTYSETMIHALHKVSFSHDSPCLGHASRPKKRGLGPIETFYSPWTMHKCMDHHTIPLEVIFSLRVGHKLDSLV